MSFRKSETGRVSFLPPFWKAVDQSNVEVRLWCCILVNAGSPLHANIRLFWDLLVSIDKIKSEGPFAVVTNSLHWRSLFIEEMVHAALLALSTAIG